MALDCLLFSVIGLNILDQIMNIQYYAADWSDVLRKTNPIMFENRNRTNTFLKIWSSSTYYDMHKVSM